MSFPNPEPCSIQLALYLVYNTSMKIKSYIGKNRRINLLSLQPSIHSLYLLKNTAVIYYTYKYTYVFLIFFQGPEVGQLVT